MATLNLHEAAALLRGADSIVILAHSKPDGDTLGSSFALLYALEKLGKTARVECADPVQPRFGFLYSGYEPKDFEPGFVVAVDTADAALLARLGEVYQDRIDLCIDHHKSNAFYAKQTLLDVTAAAAGEIIYQLIVALGVQIDRPIANAVFTAITTDTGGFRFAGVTARTHRIAADLIGCGADHAGINQLIFETKTRGRIAVDRLMLETIRFDFGGLCATIVIPADIKERYTVTEDDLEGISSLPRTIEGVLAGVTVRENRNGSCRISLRTKHPLDASSICAALGGGGHANAAGATVYGELADITGRVLGEVEKELELKQVWTAS